MPELFLLTGEIHSGKTTSLLRWSENRNDVHGILTPVVDGKRMFMDVFSKELFPMEASGEEEVLQVGRYRFSKAGFERADSILLSAIGQDGWLIIDEIGPLELSGRGFYNTVDIMLRHSNNSLVLVIRSSILQRVIEHFRLEPFSPQTINLDFFKH